MLKNSPWSSLFLVLFALIFSARTFAESGSALGPCEGDFPNPVTDICWSCLFPIHIGAVAITASGQADNGDPPPPMICSCPAPPPMFIRYGVGISFWEPARIAEVVRTPMCSPTLGGSTLFSMNVAAGTHETEHGGQDVAFYQVHWIQYPVLNWLGMAITEGACEINESFDMAYLSELDPLWDDDELSFVLNPEAALFANPVAQAACVADSAKASLTLFGIDSLFWCSGSQGSLYPLSGTHANHVGALDSSLALTHTMIFKLHREFLAQDTSTMGAMCGPVPQPILRKNQYKQNMMHPVAQNTAGFGLGVPTASWGAGREFPYKGEDFTYLIWRKRSCCAF